MVEDNVGDVELTSEFLRLASLDFSLTVISDGHSAIEMLAGAAPSVRADLILLDLNLPGRSGLDVLVALKQQAARLRTPVIVLSSTNSERDVARAYSEYANAFIRKPQNLSGWQDIAQAIADFFFEAALLPTDILLNGHPGAP